MLRLNLVLPNASFAFNIFKILTSFKKASASFLEY